MSKDIYIYILSFLSQVIKGSKFEGHVYTVGGCVRDNIMGNEIKDIDVVVDLENGGIDLANYIYSKNACSKPIIYETFGTAMFKTMDGFEIECVHTRSEKYPDRQSRNPIQDFGTLEEDCMRRDLTINTLYQNVSTNEILDLTKRGIHDINNHIIATPCDPDLTYSDDPLRMLRCIRFATRYGWDISDDLLESLKKNAKRIEIISRERIHDELSKMFNTENRYQALMYLYTTTLLSHIGINVSDDDKSIIHILHTQNIIKMADCKYIDYLFVMAQLTSFVSYDQRMKTLKELSFSNDEIKDINAICEKGEEASQYEGDNIDKYLYHTYKHNERYVYLGCLLTISKNVTTPTMTTFFYVLDLFNKIKDALSNNDETYLTYKLPLSGNDVIELKHVQPGPDIKAYLEMVENSLFENNIPCKDATKDKCLELLRNCNLDENKVV